MISPAVWTFRVRQGRKEDHGHYSQKNLGSNLGSNFQLSTVNKLLAFLGPVVLICKIRMICKMAVRRSSNIQNMVLGM